MKVMTSEILLAHEHESTNTMYRLKNVRTKSNKTYMFSKFCHFLYYVPWIIAYKSNETSRMRNNNVM